MRRELWECLTDWLDAAQPHGRARDWLRITGMEIDAPVEVALAHDANADGGYTVFVDAPRYRSVSGFDLPLSRLQVTLVSMALRGGDNG